MSTLTPTARWANFGDSAQCETDAGIVLERFAGGMPLEPTIAERVHALAERVTEDIRQARGLVDDHMFQSLLDDEP